MAIKEFKLGLLSDLKRPLSLMHRQGGQYELAVYVVGYVSMDVVVLSAPAVLLEPDARTATWHAAFELLGKADLARSVLVEHAVGVDGIAGERLAGPVTVEIGQGDDAADARVPAIARKVA